MRVIILTPLIYYRNNMACETIDFPPHRKRQMLLYPLINQYLIMRSHYQLSGLMFRVGLGVNPSDTLASCPVVYQYCISSCLALYRAHIQSSVLGHSYYIIVKSQLFYIIAIIFVIIVIIVNCEQWKIADLQAHNVLRCDTF